MAELKEREEAAKKLEQCERCDGWGIDDRSMNRTCVKCGGTGFVKTGSADVSICKEDFCGRHNRRFRVGTGCSECEAEVLRDWNDRTTSRLKEADFAVILANKILDRRSADPDDDLAVLARQVLRAYERISKLRAALTRIEEGAHMGAANCAVAALNEDRP